MNTDTDSPRPFSWLNPCIGGTRAQFDFDKEFDDFILSDGSRVNTSGELRALSMTPASSFPPPSSSTTTSSLTSISFFPSPSPPSSPLAPTAISSTSTSIKTLCLQALNPFGWRQSCTSCCPWLHWRSPKGKFNFGKSDGPRVYTRKELSRATAKFCTQSFLGKGGYGSVYKADFSSGISAAVKVIRNGASGLHQRSFAAELATLGNLQHRNLVQFKGWCFTKRELFLVYDYMPNKSLDIHLFPSPDRPSTCNLAWSMRCHIAKGIAEGLVYLHDVAQVVHRDIKAANVLLDSKLNAYISDFGLARMIRCYNRIDSRGSFGARYSSIFHDVTLGDGSDGYTAPECIGTRAQPTLMSDVFSFGVLLFEILSARKAATSTFLLVDWIHSLFGENRLLMALDPQLTISRVETEEVLGLFNLGLHCTQEEVMNRPTMCQALRWLYHLRDIRPPQTQNKACFYEVILSNSMKDIRTETLPSLLAEEECEVNLEHCSDLVKAPQPFRWIDIVTATRNFRTEFSFRGSRKVYIGEAFGQPVAIKVCDRDFSDPCMRCLETEMQFVRNIRHINILTLVGWSSDRITKKCALVYDFMPNGSLQDWLDNEERVLPWNLRFRIAKELGAALFHLHENCKVPIIHRDVRPSNVLLDAEFHVRLAGLGTGINASRGKSIIVGTWEYLDPEYYATSVVTKYADVYAYGIVMIQLVTGVGFQHGDHFQRMLEWVRSQDGNKMTVPVDNKLKGSYNELELNLLVGLGLLCCRPRSRDRPNMRRVLDILDFEVPLDYPLIRDDPDFHAALTTYQSFHVRPR